MGGLGEGWKPTPFHTHTHTKHNKTKNKKKTPTNGSNFIRCSKLKEVLVVLLDPGISCLAWLLR